MSEPADEWLPALEALNLAKRHMAPNTARIAICTRAHQGLIRARAKKFVIGDRPPQTNAAVPAMFWWAKGHEALQQIWPSGDFSTWIKHKHHLQAFGVEFNKADIFDMLGLKEPEPVPSPPPTPSPSAKPDPDPQRREPVVSGGRPRAEFWEDVIIEVARQIHYGELKATKQSDVHAAIAEWLTANCHDAAESSIRPRARKLWKAFSQE